MEHTDWQHVTLQLQIEFAETYPATAPSVRFVTPVFHPNGKNYIGRAPQKEHARATFADLISSVLSFSAPHHGKDLCQRTLLRSLVAVVLAPPFAAQSAAVP